jgi:hypothetical protein
MKDTDLKILMDLHTLSHCKQERVVSGMPHICLLCMYGFVPLKLLNENPDFIYIPYLKVYTSWVNGQ